MRETLKTQLEIQLEELGAEPTGKPLVVEARVNENRRRSGGERVPYTVEEVVEDAIECWEAGAAVFHFHARTPTGEASHDVGFYREAMAEICARTDLIVHPTTGFTDVEDPADRVTPVLNLSTDDAIRLEILALAFGVTNLGRIDNSSPSFDPEDVVYQNTRQVITSILDTYRSIRLPVISVTWELSHIRTALAYRQAGRYDHRLWQFALTDGALIGSGSPDINTLLAMVHAIPAEEEWMVLCHGGSLMNAAAHAVAMGGHVGIGLGDHDYGAVPGLTNAALVERIRHLGALIGRPLATPQQAREILGLAPVRQPHAGVGSSAS